MKGCSRRKKFVVSDFAKSNFMFRISEVQREKTNQKKKKSYSVKLTFYSITPYPKQCADHSFIYAQESIVTGGEKSPH